MTYLALLRGINVGGNNIIKMVDLKDSFEKMRFENVRTYIQSGNVLFETTKSTPEKLEIRIERALKKDFDYQGKVVVVSAKDLEQIVEEAPSSFTTDTSQYRCDVLFIKRPGKPSVIAKEIPVREGVDQLWVGKKALYFSRLTKKAAQSKLSKITGLPVYQQLTIRNWNTTTKLLERSI